MARTSRFRETPQNTVFEPNLFHTAIYARLSVMDSGNANGDCIETQINLLQHYVKERPYLQLEMVYCDNGFTGTNFRRPEWNRLIADVKTGKINCIIVKDLSRLGRDYIETGNYLDNIFPLLGVRFIAVNDNYDTDNANGYRDSLRIALKNIVNNFYAKDISKKVSSSSHLKQMKGEYQGAHPPFGYLFSEEGTHKLIVDEEAAQVVTQIFQWIIESYSDSKISKKLNEMGISTPRMHYYELGLIHAQKYAEKKIWHHSAIKRIAENQVYLGYMVRGKSQESLYDNMPRRDIPEVEWIVVPNTHEAIISLEIFNKVQDIRMKRKRNKVGTKKEDRSKCNVSDSVHCSAVPSIIER